MRQVFVDPELERQFRHQGYVVVPLLEPDQVASLLAFFEETQTPNIAGFHGTMYHNDADYRRRIDLPIRETVEANLGRWLRGYRACTCNFMVKEPGEDSSEMPLHQDWSFVHEPEDVSVHIWCPLVDVDHENGCLAVVPGSHHLSDTVRAFADDCPFREQFTMIRERFLRELPMKAGEAVMFDGRLIHSSPPNRSDKRRVTAQAIGIPADSPVYHSWRISPTQVETYIVPDEFFFGYVLHQKPSDVTPHEVLEYTPCQRTAEEIEQLAQYWEMAPAR